MSLLALACLAGCADDDAPTVGGDRDASVAAIDASAAAIDAGADAPDAAPPWLGPGADPRHWRPRTIYLALTDRFANGDAQNDTLGAPDCLDANGATVFHGGDLAGLRAGRGYLAELGVGALWVTPLTRQVGRRGSQCGYHGYWADLADPADGEAAAMEPRLGTPAQLDGLIAELAADDIDFVLDVVVNHSGYNARIVSTHPDWFHPSQGCGADGQGDLRCPLSGLPDFAQELPEVASYVTAATIAWVDRYAIGGVRMDTAKHVPTSYFADRWIPAARALRPFAFLVAEVFNDGGMVQFRKYLDAGFDSVFHFPLRRALVNVFARGGSVDELSAVVHDSIDALGLERALMLTTFLDNHDVPRFMQEAGELSDAERVRRYRLALVALFTLPGIPQLYYGDELGLLGAYPENRRDLPAWAFSAATRAGAKAGAFGDPAVTFALVKQLVALRRAHPALHAGYFAELWRQNGVNANVFAFFRAAGPDRALVALNNGASASGTLSLAFRDNPGIAIADRDAWPDGTVLIDLLGAGAPRTLTVSNGRIAVALPARTPALYVRQP